MNEYDINIIGLTSIKGMIDCLEMDPRLITKDKMKKISDGLAMIIDDVKNNYKRIR